MLDLVPVGSDDLSRGRVSWPPADPEYPANDHADRRPAGPRRAPGLISVNELGAVTRAVLNIVADGSDERSLAEQVCTACVAGLNIDGAGLSVLTGSPSRETLWATDDTAELLEDLQFTLNEGPCMEAAATGAPIFVPDLEYSVHSARWPIFTAAVLDQTYVAAVFALPLQWGAVKLGVLDLYRIIPGSLDGSARRDVLAAVDTAAVMMLSARTEPDDPIGGVHDWLGRDLGGRAEIHQATGMVLDQLKASPTDALARMRAYAFTEGRLLIDVARDVVARRLTFTGDQD